MKKTRKPRPDLVARNLKHGGCGTSEYRIWRAMWDRCTRESCRAYTSYGGRGISVDPAWSDFERFLSDVGPRPSPAYTLERVENDGNYAPGNVKWATRSEQARNTRRTVLLTFNGKTQCAKDWAAEVGIPYWTLMDRINVQGLSAEDALTRPRGRWAQKEPR